MQSAWAMHWEDRTRSQGNTEEIRCDRTWAVERGKSRATEEFFAILFLYMADCQKYGKVIEAIENAIIQKKDPFPKNVSDAYRLLHGWQNNFGGRKYVQKQMKESRLLMCPKTRMRLRRQEINMILCASDCIQYFNHG